MRIATRRPLRSAIIGLVFLGLGNAFVLSGSAGRRTGAHVVAVYAGDSQALAANSATQRPAAPSQAAEAYGKVEMSFEANHGQTDDEVKFLARGAGYTIFLTATEAVFVLARQASAHGGAEAPPPAVLKMKLEGANAASEAEGFQKLEGIVNYFIGNEPEKWHANIPTFSRVRYPEIYHGIDLVYYGTQRQLEYDFVVRPGADWQQVSLAFEGADGMNVDATSGDLLLKMGESTIRQHKPFVYQEIEGERREVESSYEIRDGGRVGFAVGKYDAARSLIIDPVLAYSTYLGGSGLEEGFSIKVDSAGNAYVTGSTGSTNFPTTTSISSGSINAFVTKLNAAGSALVYSTYLGGTGSDQGLGIAVDSAGNAYVTGKTTSTNFPTVGAIQTTFGGESDDAFVTKINSTGSALIYSTYLGGNNVDEGNGIAVDLAGNAYVAGSTSSTNFPTANAVQGVHTGPGFDAFVTKLNATGTAFVYSTYLGGSSGEDGHGIAVDVGGNAYVTGMTGSTNFPTANAFQATSGGNRDAFVTKLNASGSAFIYSTYLGGNSVDFSYSIALDSAGNSYVSGVTDSPNFPTANAFQAMSGGLSDGFVTKLNPTGSALVYSTLLGGNGHEAGYGIAVDAAGNTYITGRTASTNFPTAAPLQTSFTGTFTDAFVTKLNVTGSSLVYSTYFGGDSLDHGRGVAVDWAGNAYVVGGSQPSGVPTTANAFQVSVGGGLDAFIAKFGSYAISGRVIDSDGNGIAGVSLTLSGSSSDIRQTDANGFFIFLSTVPSGNYVVTPSEEGFTFNPPSQQINSLDDNQSLLFTGIATQTPSLQFSTASYSVREGEGLVEIIVTRTGDMSGFVSLDYATTDGTASDRSDYTTAIGRLSLLPGQNAQSFNVFVTDDAFAEGNETVNLVLSNPRNGAVLGSPNSAVLTINNDASNSRANPIDETAFFVRQHYRDFLNREPDPGGLAFWTNNITSCGADQGCREAKRIETSAAFFLSIEFQETGFYALRAYRAAFNRHARFREYIGDTQALGKRVIVGQDSWQAQLDLNKLNFSLELISRPEFAAAYAGMTNAQFVDALNANAGGSLSAAERDALVAGMNAMTETHASVLRKVVEDAVFLAREKNSAFVLMQYFGYLRRNPNDPPDLDFSGYDFWLTKLNSFAGDFRRAEMVKAFITSTEYRERFGLP